MQGCGAHVGLGRLFSILQQAQGALSRRPLEFERVLASLRHGGIIVMDPGSLLRSSRSTESCCPETGPWSLQVVRLLFEAVSQRCSLSFEPVTFGFLVGLVTCFLNSSAAFLSSSFSFMAAAALALATAIEFCVDGYALNEKNAEAKTPTSLAVHFRLHACKLSSYIPSEAYPKAAIQALHVPQLHTRANP